MSMSGEFPVEQCPYDEYRETYGPPNVKWCEERLCGHVEEPANTFSNVAYLIVAVIVAWRYRSGGSRPGYQLRELGIVVFMMGALSLIYHATNNYISQLFDFYGMFFYTSLLIAWNLRRLGVVSNVRGHTILYGVLIALNFWLLFYVPALDIPIQAIVTWNIVAILGSEAVVFLLRRNHAFYGTNGDGRYLWWSAGLALMGLAAYCSYLDFSRNWCDPEDHLWQGHALWHIFSAISIYPIARFYALAMRVSSD
ncbi:MAG: ceramidase [bacterium]|nr:ceramidase [bacterium]